MNRDGLIDRYQTGMDDLAGALNGINDEELDRPQEEGEWTVRQIVHHLADGEAMSYTRLCRLVADDTPVIQGYDEPRFAERLHYGRPIDSSLAIVRAVRSGALALMAAMTDADWAKTGTHSEHSEYSTGLWLRIYSEHVHEHADQIRRARGRTASH